LGDRIYTTAQRGRSHFFQVSFSDGQWESQELWTQKTQAYMSSPVANDETIFVHSSNERLTALDVATGNILWTGKPMGKYQSLVRDQKTMLVLNSEGELLVVKLDRDELSILDRQKLANDSWAYLGVYEGGILVRDLNALKVYRH
jgi:outer membrane protein assembly factor BamB